MRAQKIGASVALPCLLEAEETFKERNPTQMWGCERFRCSLDDSREGFVEEPGCPLLPGDLLCFDMVLLLQPSFGLIIVFKVCLHGLLQVGVCSRVVS